MIDTGVRAATEETGNGEPGEVVGIDLSCAHSENGAELAEQVRAAATRIGSSGRPTDRIVTAVPDGWLASGVEGAARREVVRLVLADELKLPLSAIVACSQAVAASQIGPDGGGPRPGAAVVCRLDDAALSFGRCDLTYLAGAVTVTLTGCYSEAAVPPLGQFGQVLAAALGSELTAEDAADAEGAVSALLAELGRRRRRLAIAVAASAANPAFGSVPVVGLAGTEPARWATAAQVTDAFRPHAQALKTAIEAFTGAAAPARDPVVLVAGPAAANPLAVDLVQAQLGRIPALARAQVRVADAEAAARGAARIARGAAIAELPAAGVRLPVHRVANGRLTGEAIELTASCYFGVAGNRGSASATIAVADDAGDEIWLEVADHTGRPTLRGFPAADVIRPGSYQVGLWPDLNTGAVFALRQADRTPAVLVALPAHPGERN